MHDALHVVPGEEPGDAIADALEPTVIILLDDVNDGSLHEAQLVFFVLGIVINGHHWEQKKGGVIK